MDRFRMSLKESTKTFFFAKISQNCTLSALLNFTSLILIIVVTKYWVQRIHRTCGNNKRLFCGRIEPPKACFSTHLSMDFILK